VNESDGVIRTMADFEAFPWLSPADVDYSEPDFASKNLPEGLKIVAETSGIEFVVWLMGYAPVAVALYENPALVQAMFESATTWPCSTRV
jgi:hypothetical protein